jgi:hypothetical protein
MSILRTIAKGFPVVQLMRAGEGRSPESRITNVTDSPRSSNRAGDFSRKQSENAIREQQRIVSEQVALKAASANNAENFSATSKSVTENKNIANPNQKGNDNQGAAPSDAQLQTILGAKGPENQIKTGGSGSDSKRSITA